MSGYDQEILDSLTPEERDGLLEDGGGDSTASTEEAAGDGGEGSGGAGGDNGGADNGAGDGKNQGDGNGDGQQGDKSGKEGAATSGDGGNDTTGADKGAGAGTGDGGNTGDGKQPTVDTADSPAAAKEQVVPLLVASAPADADAKLKDISDKKASILQQFDDGDITAKEYQTQLDSLNKEERGIERAVEKAELAKEMKQQQEMGSWMKQVSSFTTDDHPEYGKSRSRWMALDSFVKEIAAKPENANLDGRKILEMAHERVVEDLGEAPQPTGKTEPKDTKDGKPLKGAKIEPPKTLAKVPAVDNQEIGDGKFAALDRLANTDPMALEEKLMKMSAADRDEYLASQG